MPSEHAEIERKYESTDVGVIALDDALRRIGSLDIAGEPVTSSLDATYFDTADLGLLARRITLRRRTGGSDAGWHLKLPVGDDERRELHAPLGRSTRTPPKALLDEARAYLRGRAVDPVATLRTERTERTLRAADGTTVAVVADDHVRSERHADGVTQEWTEVEVELVDGRPRDLDVVEKALHKAGLRRSQWPSKLARGLGDLVPDPRPASALTAGAVGKRTTAGAVVVDHLDQLVAELLAREAGARVDAPDAVHKMRVAARRLRSALATFAPLLDERRSDPLRADLKWLGARLGGPRDAEVQLEGLLDLLERQPAAHVVGPVRRRIGTELRRRHDAAHAELVTALDSERYRRLLTRLDALVVARTTDHASRPAREEIRALTATAVHRFDKAERRARSATTVDERDVALHEVRKAAKRARYAAEAANVVGGKAAARLAQRMEDVQEVLGEHQDAVTARVLLRELALTAHAAGENAFTYGVLHGAEHERARLARAGYEDVLRAARDPKVRGWIS